MTLDLNFCYIGINSNDKVFFNMGRFKSIYIPLFVGGLLIVGAILAIFSTQKKIAVGMCFKGYENPNFDLQTTKSILSKLTAKQREELFFAYGNRYNLLHEIKEKKLSIPKLLRLNKSYIKPFSHYPDKMINAGNGYFYYFHHHRNNELGHFHVFAKHEEKNVYAHLIGISISPKGEPIEVFTTQNWVTGDTFYDEGFLSEKIEQFHLEKTGPFKDLSAWVESVIHLYKPQIIYLNKKKQIDQQNSKKDVVGKITISDEKQFDLLVELDCGNYLQNDPLRNS